MYQFSRAIYRELSPLVADGPAADGHAKVLRACEATIERLGLIGLFRIVEDCNDMPAAYMLADVVVSAGISLRTDASMSNWARLMKGTPYWRLRSAVISSSLTIPSLTRVIPSLPPLAF